MKRRWQEKKQVIFSNKERIILTRHDALGRDMTSFSRNLQSEVASPVRPMGKQCCLEKKLFSLATSARKIEERYNAWEIYILINYSLAIDCVNGRRKVIHEGIRVLTYNHRSFPNLSQNITCSRDRSESRKPTQAGE